MNSQPFKERNTSSETENGQEKLSGKEIRVENRFLRSLSNFWYHYKWYVIIIAFFIITFAVCFAQCASNDQSDVSVLIAGPKVLSAEQKNAILSALNDVMPRDFKQDGKKNTSLFTFANFTEEELKEIYDQAVKENPNEDVTVSATAYINQLRAAGNADQSNYSTAVSAGESAVLLISESLYERLRDNGRLEPLSNVLAGESVPVKDGYAVRLSDTSFYAKYDAAKLLPDKLVLCFLKKPLIGTIHDDTEYANAKEMFRAIVGN